MGSAVGRCGSKFKGTARARKTPRRLMVAAVMNHDVTDTVSTFRLPSLCTPLYSSLTVRPTGYRRLWQLRQLRHTRPRVLADMSRMPPELNLKPSLSIGGRAGNNMN